MTRVAACRPGGPSPGTRRRTLGRPPRTRRRRTRRAPGRCRRGRAAAEWASGWASASGSGWAWGSGPWWGRVARWGSGRSVGLGSCGRVGSCVGRSGGRRGGRRRPASWRASSVGRTSATTVSPGVTVDRRRRGAARCLAGRCSTARSGAGRRGDRRRLGRGTVGAVAECDAPPTTARAGGDACRGGGAGVGGNHVADPAEQQRRCRPAARPRRGRADVRRRGTAQQQRSQERAEVGVDLGQLEVDRHARAALVEVVLDLGGVAAGDAVADVGAEVLVGPAAGVVVELLRVLGEERLAQPLAGAVGQRGDGVGAHAEQRSDVGGLLALDLGVPQHQLPALGQRGERLGGGGVLEALDRGVAERHPGVERLHVVGGVQPRGRPGSGRRAAGGPRSAGRRGRPGRVRRRAAARRAPWRRPRRPGRRRRRPETSWRASRRAASTWRSNRSP